MHHTIEAFTMIGLYAALLIAIGVYLAKKESKADFIIGSRSVGIIPTAGSLAASFRDGSGIAFWVSLGLAGAYGGLWLFFGVGLASLFMAFYGPTLRKSAISHHQLTINETVAERIGPWSGKLTAVIGMSFGFCITAIQFFVSGSIFSVLLDQPQWLGVFLVTVLLIAYITMGGYKSVIITDTLQFFLIISLVSAPFFLPMAAEDYTNFGSLLSFDNENKLAFTIFGMFYILAMPEAWQRVYSARDDRTVRYAFPLMNAFLIVMTLSLIWMGMGLRVLPEETIKTYSESYLAIFDPALNISSWFLGYLIMVFLAITMSTQSAACYAFTSTLNKVFLKQKDATDKDQTQYISRSRWQMTILLILSAIASLTLSDIIKVLFDVMSFFICLAPVYALSVIHPAWLKKWQKRDIALTIITALGIAFFLFLFFTGKTKESFLLSTMPAVLVSGLLVLCYLVKRKA